MVFDMNLFWNGLTAISTFLSLVATVLIYVLARKELIKNNQISELDIYFKINANLRSSGAEEIISAIRDGRLQFAINHNAPPSFKLIDVNNQAKPFPMDQIDFELLGHLEDLAIAHNKNLISFETIMSGYGSLILVIGNSPSVYNYINYLRNEKFHDKELYTGFEELYEEVYRALSDDLKTKYRPVLC